jgi:hypothetical protein
MGKGWGIGDDCISYKHFGIFLHSGTTGRLIRFGIQSISSFEARAPASPQDIMHGSSSLSYFATAHRIETRYKAWILDHERHEFRWITADAEELQS